VAGSTATTTGTYNMQHTTQFSFAATPAEKSVLATWTTYQGWDRTVVAAPVNVNAHILYNFSATGATTSGVGCSSGSNDLSTTTGSPISVRGTTKSVFGILVS